MKSDFKNIIYLFLFFSLLALFSCNNYFVSLSNGMKIDKRLTGVWIGAETGQQFEGVQKDWKMIRKEDGSFIISFNYIRNGVSKTSTETGIWWVENEKFYEYHNESRQTDIYYYTVIDNDHIKFKEFLMSVDNSVDSYEFTDVRVK